MQLFKNIDKIFSDIFKNTIDFDEQRHLTTLLLYILHFKYESYFEKVALADNNSEASTSGEKGLSGYEYGVKDNIQKF